MIMKKLLLALLVISGLVGVGASAWYVSAKQVTHITEPVEPIIGDFGNTTNTTNETLEI